VVHLQITASTDARLVIVAVRRLLRRPLLIARCAGWAAIAVALVDGLDPVLIGLGLLLAVVIPVLAVNLSVRKALRDGHLTTYEISDGGVASSNVDLRQAFAWRAFSFVEQASGQLFFGLAGTRTRAGRLFLGVGGTRMLPVPTAGLTPAEIEQVLGAAAGNGLRVRRA
jgi:hypothetical protein